jgi:hypothetical protein
MKFLFVICMLAFALTSFGQKLPVNEVVKKYPVYLTLNEWNIVLRTLDSVHRKSVNANLFQPIFEIKYQVKDSLKNKQ